MLCSAVSPLFSAFGSLSCPGAPAYGAVILAGLVALASLVLVLRSAAVLWRRAVAGALVVLTGLMLAFAAMEPKLSAPMETSEGGMVVVLVDGSESFWRDPDRARAALDDMADRIGSGRISSSDSTAGNWQGQVLIFGASVESAGAVVPLDRLAEVVRQAEPPKISDQSNGAAGLQAALSAISKAGGRGQVILATDGLFDAPVPDATLANAVAAGVAVNVFAAGSLAPGRGLVALDLGPDQWIGRPAAVRTTIAGGGEMRFSDAATSVTTKVPPADHLQAQRANVVFAQRGLRHVSVRFDTEGHQQDRTLYTLVRGPARVLVYGAAAWADGLDPVKWLIERGDPAAPADPAGFDAVVVDSLSPTDFAPGFADGLLKAADGTGIFLINGPMRGTKEQVQRIGDWNASPLSPILPVDSDPRKFVQEPPPRNVVIMIDVSGSMAGGPLATAEAAAHAIMAQLRPQDTIEILPFSDGSDRRFEQTNASPQALAQAQAFVDSLVAGGGTEPAETLAEAAKKASNYCSYFFLSDGGFTLPPGTSPKCYTTAIATAGMDFPPDILKWGDAITLQPGSGVDELKLRYFEPDVRTEYFREGSVTPITVEDAATFPPVPPLDGVALSFPRVDASVPAIYPTPPPDPVLAFRHDGTRRGISTAVLLSQVPQSWASDPAGKAVMNATLTELIGWKDQNRYAIRLTLAGDVLTARITVQVGQAGKAMPQRLTASLTDGAGATHSLNLAPIREAGVFQGIAQVALSDAPGHGTFVIEEPGAQQRIPMSFPASVSAKGQSSGEPFDSGIAPRPLVQIAALTGGQMPFEGLHNMAAAETPPPIMDLAAMLIALALLAYALSFWVGGGRP